ncbi:MAG: NUDIX domain-containing protein [Saprospiraceae bacterium]
MKNDFLGSKRSAVFCLIFQDDNILLIKRKYPPHQGYYVPIGGKIDAFETPDQAVIREVKEESGYAISNPNFSGILVETSPLDYNWISFIYKVDVSEYIPHDCDEGELMWVPIKNISNFPIPETDSFIYDYCISNTPFIFDAVFDEDMKLNSLRCKLSQNQLIG